MEKIGFSGVSFEVTRRCNLKCKHCMRGEAQNIDLTENAIDNFLDQTLGIDNILFTGGEPLLAIDKIEYIINGIIKRNIIVREIRVITNGTIKDPIFYEIIRKTHDYLKMLHEMVYGNEVEFNKNCIAVAISYDQYHNTEDIRKNTYEEFVENMGDYAYIGYHNAGEYVSKIGRAKQLDCGRKISEDIPFRVEMFGKDRKCYCPNLPSLIDKTDFLNIVCNLDITAKGFLTKTLRYGEFDVEDKKVFQISDLNNTTDILKDIDKYNDGKPLCIMAQKQIRDKENETRHNAEEMYKQYKEMKDANERFSKHEDKELFSIPESDEKRSEKMFRALYDVKDEEDFKLKGIFYTYKFDEDIIISQYYNKNNQYYKYSFLSDEEREKIKNSIDVPKLIKKNARLKTLKMIEDMKQYDCTTEEQLQSIYKIIVNDFNGNIEEAGKDISIMLYNPLELEEAEEDDKSEYVFFTEETLRAFYKNMNKNPVKTLQTIRRAEEFTRLLALITNFGCHHEKYCKDEIRNDTYKQKAYEFLGAVDVYLYELSKYDYWNFKEYFDVSRDEISKLKGNLDNIKKFYNNLLANPLGATIGFFLKGLFK